MSHAPNFKFRRAMPRRRGDNTVVQKCTDAGLYHVLASGAVVTHIKAGCRTPPRVATTFTPHHAEEANKAHVEAHGKKEPCRVSALISPKEITMMKAALGSVVVAAAVLVTGTASLRAAGP